MPPRSIFRIRRIEEAVGFPPLLVNTILKLKPSINRVMFTRQAPLLSLSISITPLPLTPPGFRPPKLIRVPFPILLSIGPLRDLTPLLIPIRE